uniref:Suppressor of IKBKE 1 n=1 Tax=Zonotrichia albicollis TaxID=44394 RepID=A0A8D2NF19_ZONAL
MNLNLLSQTLAHLKLFPFRSECLILLAAVSLFTVFTDKGLLIKENEEIESQIDRICEMGEVMRKAVQVDDEQFFKVQEKLAQLELENKELRELLLISKESFEVGREDLPD